MHAIDAVRIQSVCLRVKTCNFCDLIRSNTSKTLDYKTWLKIETYKIFRWNTLCILTKVFIVSDWCGISHSCSYLYGSNVLIFTFSSMATNHQDWQSIRVHCCVEQCKMSARVLGKTKTSLLFAFAKKGIRQQQHQDCVQTIAHASDQITIRRRNLDKNNTKGHAKIIFVKNSML